MKAYIKYCPRCASQELDFTSYVADGNVLCLDCRTIFVVQSIRVEYDSGIRPAIDAAPHAR